MNINQSPFTEHDYTIEVHNHHTIRYCEDSDQNYLILLWDKERWRGNFGGFTTAEQAYIAVDALRRGISFGLGLKAYLNIAVVETNHYHEIKPIE